MRDELVTRLQEAGVDPAAIDDPHAAWLLLHRRFGLHATLIDRLDLEAHHRGVPAAALPGEDRHRIGEEVLAVRYPGIELIGPGGGDPVHVVPYDPAWPDRFAAWRARLATALGEAAVRIEHVGSTAVPGLTAKPVIDVQVSVRDVEDETTYVGPIEWLGIPLRMREPGHRYFRPRRGEPRVVQIHVCAAGGTWEQEHLAFRDHLRTHPDARDAYAELKVELAISYRDDRLAYNEAKTHFILDTLAAIA